MMQIETAYKSLHEAATWAFGREEESLVVLNSLMDLTLAAQEAQATALAAASQVRVHAVAHMCVH